MAVILARDPRQGLGEYAGQFEADRVGSVFDNNWAPRPGRGRKEERMCLRKKEGSDDATAFCCWWSSELPLWMATPIWPSIPWLTRAVVLWLANFTAFVFHTALTFVVLGLSTGLSNWEQYGGVMLPVYRTRIRFVMNTAEDSAVQWDLVPEYVLLEGEKVEINLTAFTIAFFALSAFFHLVIVVISYRYTLYYWWIDSCRQPLRCAYVGRRPTPVDPGRPLRHSHLSHVSSTSCAFAGGLSIPSVPRYAYAPHYASAVELRAASSRFEPL